MNWYIQVIKRAINFEDRARRKEYWMFYLFNMIILFVIGFSFQLLQSELILEIGGTYIALIILPCWAVTVRRLHDVGKSGWFIFIPIVPLIGWIIFLYLLIKNGDPSDNRFGPNPKTVS
ncbi:DUF805 domain-containing protein [Vibrio sp. NFV-1]|uniref:DUF805 domain-containing protein n=2 Tax=Vibrio nitrifigilis TaxID=2789781 RepID=A0ABS0GID9_9VIBR|nr:DUF805 domain-containing protein [Vibrio nitrifigilis]